MVEIAPSRAGRHEPFARLAGKIICLVLPVPAICSVAFLFHCVLEAQRLRSVCGGDCRAHVAYAEIGADLCKIRSPLDLAEKRPDYELVLHAWRHESLKVRCPERLGHSR